MRKILLILVLLILLPFEVGWGYGIVTNTATRDSLSFPCNPLDSLGSPVNLASGDSIYVMVIFPGGGVAYRDSMAWNDASIIRLGWEDFAETTYVFMERVSVIDGAGVDGLYRWYVKIQDLTGAALTTQYTGEFQIVNSTLESSLDSAGLSAVDVQNIDAWDPILDNDSLIIDQSTLIALKPTTAGRTLDVTAAGEAGLDLDNTTGTFSKTEIPALTYFDTLIYIGEHGLGIFIDSTAGNTNTVIGVDGTENNPVSTLAAGRTLALALGAHRFYLHGGSTFNGATTDLGADYSEWEFYGEGHGIEIAFGGQLVTNSYFHGVTLSGAMHASGGDVRFQDCIFGFISANFNGHASNCWLSDTIVLKVSKNILLSDCQSNVAGNETPTIDMTGGSSTINMTNYSGGIRIMNGASNDTISVQTDGQVIISANNTSLNITLRGMLTPTDSGTTTSLTKDAVFSRQEVYPDIADYVWDELASGHTIANSYGDTLPQEIELNQIAIAEVRSYMDTLIYIGELGVWLDGAASNTNTVVGTDGTRSNPVSTIAAATTIAGNLGTQAIWLVNSTSITLAQSYASWQFMGKGINNTINFGSQNVDKSAFISVTITGTQGGTELIYLLDCGINAADSLEVFAENCWFIGNNSVKAATNICFNGCKSAVAGNAIPLLSFNSSVQPIDVNIRHYSGGMEFALMTDSHTVSIEGHGQVVVNANCTDANITIRGHMTITDNGTTSDVTDDAVFSRQDALKWIWSNIDTTASIDTSILGIWFSTAITASLSDANMGAIADSVWDKIYADAIAVAGSMGKFLADSLNAIIDSINNSATVEIAMDSMSNRGFVHYDSSQATLQLAGLSVTATANNNAVTLAGSGTGEGFKSTGGTTGNAFELIGGSSTGNAFRATTATAQPAIQVISTTGPGIHTQGKYGLQAVGQTSYGILSEGSKSSGDSAGIAAIGGIPSAGILAEIDGLITRTIANTVGTIDGATPTTVGFSATELTQGDDHWNDQMILILTGNAAGQTARITDFTAATDSITFTPAISTAPAQNDSFVILGLFVEEATATLSDAAMGAIGDTVWLKDTTGLLTAGRYGLEATTGGAASVSDAAISLMMDSMSLRGHITYDSNGVLQLSGLYIIATPGGESTAVEFQGDGAGHGLFSHGDLAANAGNTGYGGYFRGAFNGLYGGLFDAVPISGRGLGALAPGSLGVGFYTEGGNIGFHTLGKSYGGYGFYTQSDSGGGWQSSAATACDTCSSKHAAEFLGGLGANNDAIAARGRGTSAVGASFWGDNAAGFEIVGSVTSGNTPGMTVSVGQGTGVDIQGTQDTVNYVKNVGSIAGIGSNTVTLYAIDTLANYATPASGTAKMDVLITVASKSGSDTLALRTNSSGYITLNLQADTFFVTGSLFGYAWDGMINNRTDTLIVTGTQTDSLLGREIQVSSSALSQTCDVTVQVVGSDGNAAKNIKVIAYLVGDNLKDSAGHGISNPTQSKKTDVNGNVTFSCIWSSYIIPATKWKFSATLPGAGKVTKTITVPRQATYTLDF